jgi:hypothetical protein
MKRMPLAIFGVARLTPVRLVSWPSGEPDDDDSV